MDLGEANAARRDESDRASPSVRATRDFEATAAPLQPRAMLARRRSLVAALNLVLYAALCLWLATILGAGGWSALDLAFFACFVVGRPAQAGAAAPPADR